MEKSQKATSYKKLPTPVCDFISGSRQVVNFAADTAIDASAGIIIGAGVALLPEVSIPAIFASSVVGQTILSNLFSNLTEPGKTAIHGLTENMIPDGCKPEPKVIPVIPMGNEPLQNPSTSEKSQQKIQNKITNIKHTQITNLMINMGVPESQLENIFKKHTQALEKLEKKLDKVIEWQERQDELQAQQQIVQTMQDMQSLCSSLSALGNAIGCKELEKGAAILGAAVQIGLGVATCFANPIMGAALIIGGIAKAIGLFSEPGPNPHQIILDQIGKLSEQVAAMHGDMLKLFNQNFRLQKFLLDVLQQGVITLSKVVKGEVGSFRVNMQASLERIEAMQRDLSKQITLGHQQIYLKDFVNLQARVNDYLAERYSAEKLHYQALKIANEVAQWSNHHAANALINGSQWKQIESIKINPEVLSSVFDENPLITANNSLGFFSAKLPHPVFWLHTVKLYTDLTKQFWNIDFDPLQQNAIKKSAYAIVKYCEKLNLKPQIWNKALGEYYGSLENIQKIIQRYAEHRSKLWIANCNNIYDLNENRKKDAGVIEAKQESINPMAFNLLEGNIDSFIETFRGRKPNQIQLQLHDNECAFVEAGTDRPILNSTIKLSQLNDLNTKQIYQNVNLDPAILLVEFFGLTNGIIANQARSVSGLNKKLSYSNKARERALILSESALEFNTEERWELPFNILVKFNNEEAQPIKSLVFSKQWHEMSALSKFWDDKRQKDEVGEYNDNPLMVLNSDNGKKHLNNHINLIKDTFNSAEILMHVVSDANNLAQTARSKIEAEIIRQRQRLAWELIARNVTDDAQSQAILEELKKQLVTLDFNVRQLQHLLYLAGKDTNISAGKVLIEKLISSQQILMALESYAKQSDINQLGINKPTWLSMLENALLPTNQINVQAINNLKSGFYPAQHPVSIAKRGLLLLDFSVAIREAYRLKYPLYTHYLALEKYQTEESRRYLEEALKEIFQLVETTFANKYKKAKFRIEEDKLSSTNEVDYKKFYYAFLQWCCSTSREKVFIGDKNVVLNNFSSAEGWQTLVRLKMERGWERNINLLYQIAVLAQSKNAKTVLPKVEEAGLINYLMWRDGMDGVLKMLAHPLLEKPAEGLLGQKSIDFIKNRINLYVLQNKHLEEIYLHGEAFYQINEYIIQSPIVDKLLAHYVATFEQLLGVATEKKKDSTVTDQIIYDALIQKQFACSTIKLLDSLDADRLLLQNYCEMLLGYFPWQNKFKAFKTKVSFLAWLKPVDSSKATLEEKLNQYLQEIVAAKESIADIFEQIRELIQLREALLALGRGDKNPTLSMEGSCLIINAHDFKFGFDDLKVNLLDNFLSQAKGIQGIRFVGEDFSNALYLKNALRFIKKNPQIHTLGLWESELDSKVIEECKKEFQELQQIHTLDLSNNHLFNNDEFVFEFDMDRLCNLLKTLSNLKLINITHCGLNAATFVSLCTCLSAESSIKTTIQLGGFQPPNKFSTTKLANRFKFYTKSNETSFAKVELANIGIFHSVCVGSPTLEKALSTLNNVKTKLEQRITAEKSFSIPTENKLLAFTNYSQSSFFTASEEKPHSSSSAQHSSLVFNLNPTFN